MSGIALIILCGLLSIIALLRYKNIFNPVVMFCTVFAFCSWLSTLKIDNVNIPSNEIYLMVGLGVLFFWVGGMMIDNPLRIKRNNSYRVLNYKRLKIISIIGIASSIVELKNTVEVLLHGGLAAVYAQRLAVQFDGAYNAMRKSFIESVNSQFIFAPIMYFLIPAFIYLYFKEKKKKYFVYSVFALLAVLISNGGRTIVLVYIIYYLISLSLFKAKSNKIFAINKSNSKYWVGGTLILIILTYVFLQRQTDISKTIGSYFGYPIIHMQEKLVRAGTYQYTYGMSSFQGILRPIINVFEIITGNESLLMNNATKVSDIANAAIRLSPSVLYNAFVTPFYYFYIDFGWSGICVLSLVFGGFSNIRYRRFMKYPDDRNTILFMLSFALPICFSFVRFQYALGNIPWAMILTFFCTTKESDTDDFVSSTT